jgi:hypothetical protein
LVKIGGFIDFGTPPLKKCVFWPLDWPFRALRGQPHGNCRSFWSAGFGVFWLPQGSPPWLKPISREFAMLRKSRFLDPSPPGVFLTIFDHFLSFLTIFDSFCQKIKILINFQWKSVFMIKSTTFMPFLSNLLISGPPP